MKKRIFTFGMLATVLAGCAANGSFRDRDYTAIAAFPSKMTQSPAKGSEFEVEPGKSMFSSVRHHVVPGIQLDHELNHRGRYSDNYDSLVTVPAGVLTTSGKDAGGTFYESS
ncbi:hypothetical protein Q8A64_12235 [Oxalobacteraceae bacterium R-40]|uniref:Uncharacterized protein n=1 Tax=Keguizhuia sedimenti TaxID=3064264 RepID=A0ABU1BSD6_9BURK|nr:hypothetical protein [Oxalobacteraceae bacterium R-40]